MDMDRFEERMARRRDRWHGRSGLSGMLFGGLVVVVGLLMLLDNLNIIRFHDLWRYWPLVVVILGLVALWMRSNTIWADVGGLFGPPPAQQTTGRR